MITDAEIKEVAKAYCIEMGMDPDQESPGLPNGQPAWRNIVEFGGIKRAIAMHRALKTIKP